MRLVWMAVVLAGSLFAAEPDGGMLFAQRCSSCHWDTSTQRIPSRTDLAKLTPEQVITELTKGRMTAMAQGLTADQIQILATFVTAKTLSTVQADPNAGHCTGTLKPFSPGAGDWNGWSSQAGNTRYQPTPGLAAADVPKLKLKWAFGFPNALMAPGQPVVVGGRVFIGSAQGIVYSLDQESGCVIWTFDAGATVRSAVTIAPAPADSPASSKAKWIAYFGDLHATAHAVDAETGESLWKAKLDPHVAARITGSPTFYQGRIYFPVASLEEADAIDPAYECCTFRGSVAALDAGTGHLIWQSYSITDPAKVYKTAANGHKLYGPAGAGIWSSPTIDAKRKRVYVGTGNSFTGVDVNTSDAILAFDLDNGNLIWASQVTPKDNWVPGCPQAVNCPENPGEDLDFGSSPVLRTVGKKDLLIAGQKSGVIWALDPDQRGKVLWSTRVGKGGQGGGIEWGQAIDDRVTYAAIADSGRRDGTPGLYAVRIDNGQRLWSTAAPANAGNPAQSGAVSAIPGAVFSGSMGGRFRAYDTKTGGILWEFDALLKSFETVNKVEAKGGSFNGGGAAIANGMVLVNSGYGLLGGTPGNVLLAFTVDGK